MTLQGRNHIDQHGAFYPLIERNHVGNPVSRLSWAVRLMKKLLLVAALVLAGCADFKRAIYGRCYGADYESSTCHADGTPVTEVDRAETMRRADEARQTNIAECQRLYTMLGDRTLTPMQIEAIRVSMNTRRCTTSGWRPQ
jgi:hypothetical protein